MPYLEALYPLLFSLPGRLRRMKRKLRALLKVCFNLEGVDNGEELRSLQFIDKTHDLEPLKVYSQIFASSFYDYVIN